MTSSRRNPGRPRYRATVAEPPSLAQFVILSMLLHVLLIVLFGNPTGGPRRNEGWRGPLDVTLGRMGPESGPGFRLAPGVDSGAPGAAALEPAAGAPNEPASRRPAPPPPEPPARVEAIPRLNPSAPEEVARPLSAPTLAPVKVEPGPPPQRQLQLAPPVEAPPRAIPTLPVVPVEKPAAPSREPQLSPPAELPPPALPQVLSAPLERAAPPAPERAVAPAAEVPPREMPATPAAPLERVAPPRIEPDLAPPVEVPRREVPVAPAAPIERLVPGRIEPEIAAPVTVPPRAVPLTPATIERVAPVSSEREIAAPAAAPTRGAEPRAPATTVPSTVPQAPAAEGQMPQRSGPSDANEDIFKPRRDVGAPAGEAPRIDLDAARKKAAREIVSEGTGSRGLFTVPPPPERKSKAANALEKAIKPDCRTAYADMGLLAAPVLIASAIAADGSCRW